MLGTAGSQVGAAGSGSVGGRGDPLLDSALVDCDLAGRHPVHFSLVVEVGIFEVHFVVLPVGALHHVVLVHVGHVLLPAAQTLSGEDLLLGPDNVDPLLRFGDFLLQRPQKLGTACITQKVLSTSILSLLMIISMFSIFMPSEWNWASAWPVFIFMSRILLS